MMSSTPSFAMSAGGCRLIRSQAHSAKAKLIPTSNVKHFNKSYLNEISLLGKYFNVNAFFGFYDDKGNANAKATDEVISKKHPDGAVLFGQQLFNEFQALGKRKGYLFVVSTLAHEWAHVRQYKSNVNESWVVKHELSADYLAGWYLAKRGIVSKNDVKIVQQSFSDIGDTAFKHVDHHGTPLQRSQVYLLGTEASPKRLRDALTASYSPEG